MKQKQKYKLRWLSKFSTARLLEYNIFKNFLVTLQTSICNPYFENLHLHPYDDTYANLN